MKTPETLRYDKLIITCLISFLIALFSPFVCYAQAQDEEKCVVVSSFDEFTSSLNQIQSTGGTIILTQDITVTAEESYAYNNGRYRKEVVIETKGHTIDIEGHLELWPFLTIHGDGSQKELLHVYPGGELRLVSICLDAGEKGVAVIQEEGSFLMYGSEDGMSLPAFSCTGQIISSQTMTAASPAQFAALVTVFVVLNPSTRFSPRFNHLTAFNAPGEGINGIAKPIRSKANHPAFSQEGLVIKSQVLHARLPISNRVSHKCPDGSE